MRRSRHCRRTDADAQHHRRRLRRDTKWHSAQVNGWVSLQVTFPSAVMLKSVEVHSQHSGRYHAASQVQAEYLNPANNQFTYLYRKTTAPDDTVPFNPTNATTWKIDLLPADGWSPSAVFAFIRRSTRALGYQDQSDAIVSP